MEIAQRNPLICKLILVDNYNKNKKNIGAVMHSRWKT